MQPVYIQRIASIHPQGYVENHPYLQACEPDYRDIITNATLRRRMSRIVKMGVACGLECIGELSPEKIKGIITATGLGCLVDTEKFLNTLIDNEERMLNPTPFIQSTFNTIGAQIALIRQIHAYNMTYVHRGLSFESALLDAMMKIWEGDGQILVGAMDEMTNTSYTIQKRLGILKGTEGGEGAQFFLLSREAEEHPLAEISGLETFTGQQTAEEIKSRTIRFLQRNGLDSRDIQWLVTGRNRTEKDCIYEELETNLFPESIHLCFKDECGEYPTASSYAVWKVVKEAENCTVSTNILIYNHHHSINHSLILIRKNV
ncbi:beta-ketoacyl synthase chain length factor [uncultured Bacteroides sp.]|uniref:beta-ketoacyl synthase chain length factor n=1 Tax=uncultured Bacteroides sp. TaxID=162156 RepID=UPI0025E727BE|nr:beta-ketoacyl synthase chain length factor [uncultured Bacteroides sp.]